MSHAERAPVSRASCVRHESFFPFSLPPQKINNRAITAHKCVQTSPRVSRRTSPRVSCIMRASRIFFSLLPAPPKKNIIIITTHKCVQTSPRVSRRTSPRVSCIVICMRHGSFFFSPLPLPKKKIIIISKSAFKRAPVSHAERAPVSRASSYACVTNLFFFPPVPCPKKNKSSSSSQKCVQTSPRVSRRTSPRVSCIIICMRHGSFFFSPCPLPKKK